ncbi:hypothetical protein J437_LFUL011948 [Ladona fulva]|uniref:RING-CH-type domain-containing protein n=1 Tax=Ladona fulva TaxID=123851 RepID=A0A8K0KBN3_LADFU|nr:hypothetical protein J437_LFUL011948 [Ladona fulva]
MIHNTNSEEAITEDVQEIFNDTSYAEDSSHKDGEVTLPLEEPNNTDKPEDNDRIEADICRICHEVQEDLWLLFGEEMEWNPEPLESLCLCKGTIGLVHKSCLERWLTETRRLFCELCGFRYETNISPRYTRIRSFLRWTTHSRGRGPEITEIDPQDYATISLSILKGLTFFGATTALMHLTITTLLSAADHLEVWYRWWQSDNVIKVIVTPQEDRADRVVPEETRFHRPFMF